MSSESNPRSFLEPRTPHAWNRKLIRPREAKKNLVHDMAESDEDDIDDTIKVYLRIKPCPSNLENTLEVLSSRILLTKVPQDLIKKKKILKPDNCKYTFTKILHPTTTQNQLFSCFVEKAVHEVLNGKDHLLFSYGTTNAGKTFTVQGNAEHPGIIPRAIAMIFKNISNKLQDNNKFYPCTKHLVAELNSKDFNELSDLKNKILAWNAEKNENDSAISCKSKPPGCSYESLGNSSYKEMQHKLDSEVPGNYVVEENVTFSVWVSFVEIYNEGIYDLLQAPNEKGKRNQLKLVQDHMKNTYIKGLKHINVTSASEAYKVLQYGRNNLCFARTGMNDSSSRSHCIFTIKLTKFENADDLQSIIVSSFSICDLAGAERQRNALNVGDRLRESQNINCSLHVLSRCFNVIRENQSKNEKQRIPYRDSKLTQIFQNALNGNESITMVINVNSSPELFEETQHVLKASAIAKKIVYEQRPKISQLRLSRFSQVISSHKRDTLIPWDSSVQTEDIGTRGSTVSALDKSIEARESVNTEREEDIEYLMTMVEGLQQKLKAEREKCRELKVKNSTLEKNLREELSTQFLNMLQQKKERYEQNLQRAEQAQLEMEKQKIAQVKRHYEKKFQELKQKMNFFNTSFEVSSINNYNETEVEELKEQIKELESQVNGLKEVNNVTKEEKNQFVTKLAILDMQYNALIAERDQLQQSLEAAKSKGNELLIEELQKVQKELGDKIKVREEYLEEARDDLENVKKENESLEELVTGLEIELKEKDLKLDDLETQLSSLKDLLSLKNDEIEALEAKEDDLKELEMELEKVKSILSQKENFITELENRLEVEIEKYNEVKTLESNFQVEMNSLKEKCCEQEAALNVQEIEMKKVNDILLEKKNAIVELECQLKEKITKCNELECSFKEVQLLKEKCSEQESKFEKIVLQQERLNRELLSKNEIISNLEEQLLMTSKQYEELQEAHSVSLNKKCELCEKQREDFEQQLTQRNSEISVLEKSVKESIQKNGLLQKEVQSKHDDINLLKINLMEAIKTLKRERTQFKEASLNSSSQDQEIERLKSEIKAYQEATAFMMSCREEYKKKDAELAELRKRTHEQSIVIQSQDRDLETFQANQKTINARYEEQLKKCKEEIEREKREATSLSNTLYKSTPTPKKELQSENEKLKEELRAEKLAKMNLIAELSILKNKESKTCKENEDPKKAVKPKTRVNRATFVDGESEDDVFVSNERKLRTKSQPDVRQLSSRKTRGQRLKESNSDVPDFYLNKDESTIKLTKKGNRRKLYDDFQDSSSAFDSFEMEKTKQESPRSAIKNSLRKRTKPQKRLQ